MNLDEIENRINSIFSEDYNRQIIFWYDENQEFIEDIENIQLNNAKLYVLKENNLIKPNTKLNLKIKNLIILFMLHSHNLMIMIIILLI